MAYYKAGPDSSHLQTATALFGTEPQSVYGMQRVQTAAGSIREVGFTRSVWIFSIVPVSTYETARQTLLGTATTSAVGYVETRDAENNNIASDCIIRFPDTTKLERWDEHYLGVTIEFILTSSDSIIQWGEGLMSDYVTESELAEAIATHTANVDAHQALVTLTAALASLLGITDQELDLVAQAANTVVAGPTSGADAKPTARALVDADIPSGIARDTEVTNEIALHAAIDDAHHDPVTLAWGSDPALSISTQELSLRAASDSQTGVVELATETEAETGTDTGLVVTPAGVAAKVRTLGDMFTADDIALLLGPGCPMAPGEWRSLRRQTAVTSGAFHQVPGRWPGTRALVAEKGTTNLFSHPVGVGTSNFISSCSTLTDQCTDDPTVGQYNWRSTADISAGNWYVYQYYSVSPAVGTTYTAKIRFKLEAGTSVNIILREYYSGGSSGPSTNVTATGQWQEVSLSKTTTSSSVYQIRLYLDPNVPASGQVAYIDAMQLEEFGVSTSFCSGDMGTGYSWSGTPHASSSTRATTQVNLDDYASLISGNNTWSLSMRAQMPYNADATWPREIGYNYLFDTYYDDVNRILLAYSEESDKFVVYVNGGERLHSSAQAFSAGDWLHLVITFDFSNDEYHLYINGELDSSSDTALTAPTLEQLNIGSAFSGSFPAGCAYSEFTLFTRVLTQSEVLAIYSSDEPLTDPGALVANTLPAQYQNILLFNTASDTTGTTATEVAYQASRLTIANQEPNGIWQFYAVLDSSSTSGISYAKLQYLNSATWVDVPGAAVNVTGVNADFVLSDPIAMPLGQKHYRVVWYSNNASYTATIIKAGLLLSPGEIDNTL